MKRILFAVAITAIMLPSVAFADDYQLDWTEWTDIPSVAVADDAGQQESGLNAYDGVNYHDGRTEMYYSSNVLYHYRTPEWTLDDEGFYRTQEGRYVVAASDLPYGTVFTGSKGECEVLDSGCAEGVTDYYVNW